MNSMTKRLCFILAVAVLTLVAVAPTASADDSTVHGCGGNVLPEGTFGVAPGCFDGSIVRSPSDPLAGSKQFTQAAGHPYSLITHINLNSRTRTILGLLEVPWPVAPQKDILTNIPPGLLANPTAVSECSIDLLAITGPPVEEYTGPRCPASSQVGVARVRQSLEAGGGELPVYNMVPPPGVSTRLAFDVAGAIVTLDARLRSGSDYGITIDVKNIDQGINILGVDLTVWGIPADPAHNSERNCPGTSEVGCSAGVEPAPYLRMPTSCPQQGQGLAWSLQADSWWNPATFNADGSPDLSDPNWKTASFISHNPPGLPGEINPDGWGSPQGPEGCSIVPVRGELSSAQTTSQDAETPTGLNVKITVPDPGLENPSGIASSDIKAVKVTLPEGLTINPSQGVGLGACTPAQYASEELSFHPNPETGCPSTSKIGTVTVRTPLLEEALEGSVYIATPFDNPSDSLLALYVVIKNPERGVMIKLAGKIDPDPKTGQLVSTFENLPQLPFSSFELQFREGVRAPLATPKACGTYTTEAQFTPWSDPNRTIVSQSSFEIIHGVGGGPCVGNATPPFHPGAVAGTLSNAAGSYSPFYLRLIREDGEQEISKFTTILPSGLTGNLSGIPFCPDAAIEAARVATGTHELNEPSCPAASEIGHTIVGAGVGTVLAQTPGKVYLAGPYHGSALSIVSVTSATVGPFDLGTVVIRFALRINPTTAQVEVDSAGSDPIPHIIDGIVVHVRDIRVYVDRSKFILNPTSCNPMSILNTVTGAGAGITGQDGLPVTVTSPFQAADCSNLAFKPVFKVSTSGKTSRTNGASLSVKLSYPTAPLGTQANIRSVKVDLPKQLPSRLTTLQKACPDSTFNVNPASCPAASRVGQAKALTSILPVPLEGPAYFVSHGGAKFPELIIVLQGYGVTIDLHGETFISKQGITSSTFPAVPDQPVTSFELTLAQGQYSALAANGNLCKSKLVMPTAFVAQNGVVIHRSTPISVTGCKPTVTILRHSAKGSTASIMASVPSAGKLVATGNGLVGATAKLAKAGNATVRLSLSGKERQFLARHPGRRLKTNVKLLFTPKHGRKLSASVTVLLG
jgi:hypothetical protein